MAIQLPGQNKPLYFIADIGANHDGSLERAIRLIELAKEAGADAAKFQNFQASKIVSRYGFDHLGNNASHQASWKKSVYEIYEDASISFDWTARLKEKCDEVGIEYFTSPYDFESVDHIDPYVRLYKIGSGDITWTDMIAYIAQKGKPVLLATGASNMKDVERAMDVLTHITREVVLMQCNTNYTGSSENFRYSNLNVLKAFGATYPGVTLGLSDHTPGHATVLGAIALGATVFEKHFTDNTRREGPDHAFAMDPAAWKEMVLRSEELYDALGDGVKVIEANESNAVIVQRRAVCATRDLAAGETLTQEDLTVLRPMPADGFPPYKLKELIGKTLSLPVKAGEHLTPTTLAL